ncbi:hypothetical protein P280DRAFT_452322 [Massarina eburnea CBS 473.64]|uniref:RED-like N-terminal domain-containing protein n=1 Tax=Massarina eburnea CBS 473.64 TaxID=1395130 RepID=A0A6A6S0P0_9PLEO|nr:hypothetical protein P280DRAFT_452322 [Massarina eburnea CBS 473.64]
MDNQEFRRLILANASASAKSDKPDGGAGKPPASRTPGAVLGARKHSSIPMTPRQVGRGAIQADFARQLAERNAKANPAKKFRSAAPKGTRLAAGYTDRVKTRQDDDDEDEKAKRIKNLEEVMKLGELDRPTFEKLVQEITGGDISATHLVKGLDRKLLERVRKGEDVLNDGGQTEDVEEDAGLEDAFDELAEEEVDTVVREKAEKKGERATALPPPPPVAGVKRSRADILADLKRQRDEAAAAAAAEHERKYPSLGAGFRKISANGETRIETDSRGREVLIITDADGKEKRKVRKQKVEETPVEVHRHLDDETEPVNVHNLPVPKAEEEPEEPKEPEESEDEDIFEGVGSSFNPLADLDDEDDSSSEEEGEAKADTSKPTPGEAEPSSIHRATSEPREESSTKPPPAKRDYFANTTRSHPKVPAPPEASADATVLAALKKVRTLDPNSSLINDPDSQEARLKKRAAELAASDRDMEDMDLGFGGSRFDDADEMEREGEKVKFSEWRGLGAADDADDGEGDDGKAAKKRKRGPKKKKGDKNSAGDVLMVMERQKKQKSLG